MSAWAKPGVKCVCIDGVWTDNQLLMSESLPVPGQIYTVRKIIVHKLGSLLLLNEISNPVKMWAEGPHEVPFPADRFRPLVTRTQSEDVAIFLPLLETAGEDA